MQDSEILAPNRTRQENVGDNSNHRSHKRYEASAERTDGPHARLVNFGLSLNLGEFPAGFRMPPLSGILANRMLTQLNDDRLCYELPDFNRSILCTI
jgi:hypothetical protein